MSSVIGTAEKEVLRMEILNLCEEAGTCGAGIPVLKAALKKYGKELEDKELDKQISYLEDKGFVKVDEVKNAVLGIHRKIVFITAAGTDYLEGNLAQ